MDYIIQEVMVGQIVVEFVDGTRAVVGISTTDTPEQIDHLVSFYDPEFIPPAETTINTFVSVGEERCACPMDMETPELDVVEPEVDESTEPVVSTFTIESPINDSMLFYYAQKFAAAGDTRGSEKLDELMDLYHGELSMETLLFLLDQKTQAVTANQEAVAQAAVEGDDIFNLALEELENG